jgi:hypothetical protein
VDLNQLLTTPREFEKLRKELVTILEKEINFSGRPLSKQEQVAQGNIKFLVSQLLASMKDSLNPRALYPRGFPIQVLLSYFWIKAADSKEEVLTLFEQMPQVLKNPLVLQNGHARNAFIQTEYSLEDYLEWKEKLKTQPRKALAAELLKSPEKAIYLARSYEVFDQAIPILVKQGIASYRSITPSGEASVVQYADCFESTLQNLTNIMLRLPGQNKTSIRRLEEKAIQLGFKLNPKLTQFYREYETLENPFDQSRRDAWAAITANLPKVQYNELGDVSYNMKSTMSNFLQFFGHTLFLENDHYQKLRTRQSQLDYLCEFLSEEGYQLTWGIKGKSKKEIEHLEAGLDLEFSINRKPSFVFRIKEGHTEPVNLAQKSEDWRFHFYPEFEGLYSPRLRELLAWYIPQNQILNHISNLILKKNESDAVYFLFRLRLNSSENKLSFIQSVIDHQMVPYYSTVGRLLNDLPSEDFHTQCGILNALKGYEAPSDDPIQNQREKALNIVRIRRNEALVASAAHGWVNLMQHFHSEDPSALDVMSEGRKQSLAHIAARHDQVQVLQYLAKTKPDLLYLEHPYDQTPIFYAAQFEKWKAVKWIAAQFPEKAEEPNEFGGTFAHLAAHAGSLEMIQWIQSRYPHLLTQKDKNENSPAFRAAINQKWEVVKWYGVHYPEVFNEKNKKGLSLLDLALKAKDWEMAQWIKSQVQ